MFKIVVEIKVRVRVMTTQRATDSILNVVFVAWTAPAHPLSSLFILHQIEIACYASNGCIILLMTTEEDNEVVWSKSQESYSRRTWLPMFVVQRHYALLLSKQAFLGIECVRRSYRLLPWRICSWYVIPFKDTDVHFTMYWLQQWLNRGEARFPFLPTQRSVLQSTKVCIMMDLRHDMSPE